VEFYTFAHENTEIKQREREVTKTITFKKEKKKKKLFRSIELYRKVRNQSTQVLM